jgi:glycosyltransferase involved in cell wall biosynthesis
MRIAVNLVRFEGPHVGGNWTYAKNVLHHLARLDCELVCLVWESNYEVQAALVPGDAETVVVPGKTAMTAMHYNVPVLASRSGAQILFSPSHGLSFRRPTILEVPVMHDLNFLHLPMSAAKRLYKTLMLNRSTARAAKVVCVSHFTCDDVVRVMPQLKDRAVAVPNGFTMPSAPPAPKPEGKIAIFGMGQHAHKNPEFLVSVLAEIDRLRGPGATLTISGCPPDRIARLETMAKVEGFEDRCTCMPFVDVSKVEELWAAATLFLFPSGFEGFGLPVLEAMARGVPVVSSKAGALPEVCGQSAILFDELDAEAWARAALSLSVEPARSHYQALGLERSKHFSWEECARQTLEVFRMIA